MGTEALNYTQAESFIYENGKVAGIHALDLIGNHAFMIHARKVVNAAGPWVDELRQKDNSRKGKRLELTKGVHIVVPYERLPLQQAAYFDVADKRMVFAIPRGKTTYIGTTDTTYKESIDKPTVTLADVEYILKAANYMFPTADLSISDITSSWAGLRPLIHEDGKSPEELSRKDEIFYSHSGLISIAGGKLTGFRKMAERTVDAVAGMLQEEQNEEFKDCLTDELTLSGGDFESENDIPTYVALLHERYEGLGLAFKDVRDLVNKFGSNTQKILDKIKQFDSGLPIVVRIVLAETDYCVAEEMTTNLGDFFTRRTGRLYFDRASIGPLLHPVADRMAELLEWSPTQKSAYIEAFEKRYKEVVDFK